MTAHMMHPHPQYVCLGDGRCTCDPYPGSCEVEDDTQCLDSSAECYPWEEDDDDDNDDGGNDSGETATETLDCKKQEISYGRISTLLVYSVGFSGNDQMASPFFFEGFNPCRVTCNTLAGIHPCPIVELRKYTGSCQLYDFL